MAKKKSPQIVVGEVPGKVKIETETEKTAGKPSGEVVPGKLKARSKNKPKAGQDQPLGWLSFSMDNIEPQVNTSMARTRADVDVFLSQNVGGEKLDDRYPTDCLVEILEEKDGWFKIKPFFILHTKSGYVQSEALIFPEPETPPVFPNIANGTSVPPETTLKAFQAWQAKGGKPDWIAESTWDTLPDQTRKDLPGAMLASIKTFQKLWDKWIADVTANNRLDEAVMDEWIVIASGGRELYAIRDHYIYKQPVQNGIYYGCAIAGQVMRWNGNVRTNIEGDKQVTYYEVDFYRMHQAMHGWFRADLTAEYIYPSPTQDPKVADNAKNVFDLSKKILRHPQDSQINPTKKTGIDGAQYIDIFDAIKRHLIHWSLCGEFCCSALSGSDVIPLLKGWVDSKYDGVNRILNDPHEGTGIGDLKSILKLFQLGSETYTSIPTTPQRIKERLNTGQFVLAGCGINKVGEILPDGQIRHWVVIEDVLPIGNSGWVRVYNPFFNQEEVYEYNLFIKSSGLGAGLWITPAAH